MIANATAVAELSQQYLETARSLTIYSGVSKATQKSVATILQKMGRCSTTVECSFYWCHFALFVGRFLVRQYQAAKDVNRLHLMGNLFHNHSLRFMKVRSKELRSLPRGQLGLLGHPTGPLGPAADAAATFLLYADRPEYFKRADVEPFVRHLRCYTERHKIRLAMDPDGPRVQHTNVAVLNVSIISEFYFTAREATPQELADVQDVVVKLIDGNLDTAHEDLPRVERTLALNYAQPFQFGRIWAMEKEIDNIEPGAILVYLDADVTISPHAWQHGLPSLLMQHKTLRGKDPAHVFIADTWSGIECVNSGFVAVRNTQIGRLFLKMWKEKLWWSGSWDQTALAETVLEFVGAESWKLTQGKHQYHHQCLGDMMPVTDGTFQYTRYCDCWQQALGNLAGAYRQRRSYVVGFIDPERVEVNFIPNNLFYDHSYMLHRMMLAPDSGTPHLQPMMIHWAGLSLKRELLEQYYQLNFNMSSDVCPNQSDDNQTVGLADEPRSALGTRARHVRCCRRLREHRDKRKWPWNLPDEGSKTVVAYWGCGFWRPVEEEDCVDLFGEADESQDARFSITKLD